MQRTEEIEQARLVKWSHKVATRALMPKLARLHHSPNGGKRDAFTGAQMKAMGTKAGFPDLILPARSSDGQFTGLAIEMKAEKGRTSDEQLQWLNDLAAEGWFAEVCYSADEAHRLICAYLGVLPTTVPLAP